MSARLAEEITFVRACFETAEAALFQVVRRLSRDQAQLAVEANALVTRLPEQTRKETILLVWALCYSLSRQLPDEEADG
jgi:hypothetical protein